MSDATSSTGAGTRRSDAPTQDWLTAALKALVVFVLAYVGFVVVPDALVTHTLVNVAPRSRDALILIWVGVDFVFMCWLFVRLQRPLRGAPRAVRS